MQLILVGLLLQVPWYVGVDDDACLTALKKSHEAIRAAWAPRKSECEKRGECFLTTSDWHIGCPCWNIREPLDENGSSECYDCLAKLARNREARIKIQHDFEKKAHEALDRVDEVCK